MLLYSADMFGTMGSCLVVSWAGSHTIILCLLGISQGEQLEGLNSWMHAARSSEGPAEGHGGGERCRAPGSNCSTEESAGRKVRDSLTDGVYGQSSKAGSGQGRCPLPGLEDTELSQILSVGLACG